MSPAGAPTRDMLIIAAERLFAERGLLGVSQREILREAGARNATALQYHFGDREGLVRAVLDKRHDAIDQRRHELLDGYEAAGRQDVRALAGALALPLAAELKSPGGRAYLQVLAELISRPHAVLDLPILTERGDAVMRWRALLEPLLDPGAVVMHRRFVAIRFCIAELGRRAQQGDETEEPEDHEVFLSHLIDLLAALLIAPLSEQTRAVLTGNPHDGSDDTAVA